MLKEQFTEKQWQDLVQLYTWKKDLYLDYKSREEVGEIFTEQQQKDYISVVWEYNGVCETLNTLGVLCYIQGEYEEEKLKHSLDDFKGGR